uniref:Lectizyme n=1 Tax=Glossina palpalis gambiensis TaxID=67801 RepID=A0A1B0BPW0_9MUSC
MKSSIATVLTLLLLAVQGKAFTSRLQPRIVGGRNAIPGQFPYAVSLRYNNVHICGGSIISANYILTAAHCVTTEIDGEVFDTASRWLSIRAGSLHVGTGGVVVPVSEHTKFPSYFGNLGDIAVVRLAQSLNFTEQIRPINLAQAEPPNFVSIASAGWGRLSEDGPRPEILQYTSMISLSHNVCNILNPLVDESFLCLLPSRRNTNGVCNGDSGGPAVYNDRLVGVANYISESCGAPHPDVFANVAHYANWIRENSDLENADVASSNSENVNSENSSTENGNSEV